MPRILPRLRYGGLFAAAVLTLAAPAWANPPATLLAQNCPAARDEAASSTSREIRNADYGFTFRVPDNYRTVLHRPYPSDLVISVLNPSEYDNFRCLTGGRLGQGQVWPSLGVYVKPLEGSSLRAHILQSPVVERGSLREATVAGQTALIYLADGHDLSLSVSFLAPSQRQVVTVSTYVKDRDRRDEIYSADAFSLILNSFAF